MDKLNRSQIVLITHTLVLVLFSIIYKLSWNTFDPIEERIFFICLSSSLFGLSCINKKIIKKLDYINFSLMSLSLLHFISIIIRSQYQDIITFYSYGISAIVGIILFAFAFENKLLIKLSFVISLIAICLIIGCTNPLIISPTISINLISLLILFYFNYLKVDTQDKFKFNDNQFKKVIECNPVDIFIFNNKNIVTFGKHNPDTIDLKQKLISGFRENFYTSNNEQEYSISYDKFQNNSIAYIQEIFSATEEDKESIEFQAKMNKQKAIKRMSGMLSHEINNPLTVLKLCLDELEEQMDQEMIKLSSEALYKLSSITKKMNLLNTNKLEFNLQSIELTKLLQSLNHYNVNYTIQNNQTFEYYIDVVKLSLKGIFKLLKTYNINDIIISFESNKDETFLKIQHSEELPIDEEEVFDPYLSKDAHISNNIGMEMSIAFQANLNVDGSLSYDKANKAFYLSISSFKKKSA